MFNFLARNTTRLFGMQKMSSHLELFDSRYVLRLEGNDWLTGYVWYNSHIFTTAQQFSPWPVKVVEIYCDFYLIVTFYFLPFRFLELQKRSTSYNFLAQSKKMLFWVKKISIHLQVFDSKYHLINRIWSFEPVLRANSNSEPFFTVLQCPADLFHLRPTWSNRSTPSRSTEKLW
jgi:hypothetical protein